MVKAVEEALENYKKEFREYLEKTDKLKKEYARFNSIQLEEVSAFRHFGNEDYEYVTRISSELEAMERMLGLLKEEIKDIEKEIKKGLENV